MSAHKIRSTDFIWYNAQSSSVYFALQMPPQLNKSLYSLSFQTARLFESCIPADGFPLVCVSARVRARAEAYDSFTVENTVFSEYYKYLHQWTPNMDKLFHNWGRGTFHHRHAVQDVCAN